MTFDEIEVGKLYNGANNETLLCFFKNKKIVAFAWLDEERDACYFSKYETCTCFPFKLSDDQTHNISIHIEPVRQVKLGEVWDTYSDGWGEGHHLLIAKEKSGIFVAINLVNSGLYHLERNELIKKSSDQSHDFILPGMEK